MKESDLPGEVVHVLYFSGVAGRRTRHLHDVPGLVSRHLPDGGWRGSVEGTDSPVVVHNLYISSSCRGNLCCRAARSRPALRPCAGRVVERGVGVDSPPGRIRRRKVVVAALRVSALSVRRGVYAGPVPDGAGGADRVAHRDVAAGSARAAEGTPAPTDGGHSRNVHGGHAGATCGAETAHRSRTDAAKQRGDVGAGEGGGAGEGRVGGGRHLDAAAAAGGGDGRDYGRRSRGKEGHHVAAGIDGGAAVYAWSHGGRHGGRGVGDDEGEIVGRQNALDSRCLK